MAIERIKFLFSKASDEHVRILYGPGINDLFYNHKLVELRFEEALYEELRRQGYDRIVFYSPHRSVFFFDAQSEELSRPDQNPDAFPVSSVEAKLQSGPLNDLKLFQPRLRLDEFNRRNGMRDIFALRMLDRIMREERGFRSAVVILQAETTLRFFEDQRTLAGLVGDWTRLPSSNTNTSFFVFSIEDHQALADLTGLVMVPEIHNIISRDEAAQNDLLNPAYISMPEAKEIRYMILHFQQTRKISINYEELDILCQRMTLEKQKNRYWIARLQEIEVLDLSTARAQGWFSAHLQSEMSVWERLNQLVGLEPVKKRIQELVSWVRILQQRQQETPGKVDFPSLHMIFSGNPGTGKTTVARLFGEILFEIGFLRRGHLVEARISDLVADHVGGTVIKTNQVIDRALDGVLFIDEAYALVEEGRGSFGQEAIETLLSRMENERQRLVVIAAGYPERMNRFRRSDPGLERRFPQENVILFDDFSIDQLTEILFVMLGEKKLSVSDSCRKRLKELVAELWKRRDENFGNAGEIRNLVEGLDRRRASRIALKGLDAREPVTEEDIPPSYEHLISWNIPEPDQVLKELDQLVGLKEVKQFLRNLVYRLELENLRNQRNDYSPSRPRLQHMVFKGNPGTGKTTVARLVGKIYQSLGLLSRGHCVEVTRGDLVAGYVGQTALKTMQRIREALDGVLFIDEAYTLVSDAPSGFGQEAVDTLIKAMEEYQSRLVVIIAGYPEEINHLLSSNPGLLSRFGVHLEFKDYTLDELTEILCAALTQRGFIFEDSVLEKARQYLANERNRYRRYFGNARTVLSLVETIQTRLAERVVPQARKMDPDLLPNLLDRILPEDVPEPEAYIFSAEPAHLSS